MKQLIEKLCSFLDAGEDLAVATILTRSGSAPRTAGTKMIIRNNGEIFGTIGGGLVEAQAQETAREIFSTRQSRTFTFDMTGANADTMDMICGGEVEILLEYIPAIEENRTVFEAWQDALKTGRQCLLVTLWVRKIITNRRNDVFCTPMLPVSGPCPYRMAFGRRCWPRPSVAGIQLC